jgi:mRNA interferase MazF
VYKGSRHDTKNFRVFVIVSRQALIDSKFSTVICAPIYSRFDELSTQIEVGVEEGLKKASSIFCDELLSIEKSRLTDFIGTLSNERLSQLKECLEIAVGVDF